ncbi:MAG: DUF1320 family protein [Kiritimatiellaeota bacterium]|nr:DUF1320 family protein [Kiritimatiellota bacterium]
MWLKPTEQDLQMSISQAEVDSYRDAATSDVTVDTVEAILARTADLVRGYCRANPGIRLGPAGTIPGGLLAAAMDYAAVDVVKRTPSGVSDERRRARETALQMFRDAADGKMLVTSFGDADDASGGSAAQVAASSPQRFTPNELEGL